MQTQTNTAVTSIAPFLQRDPTLDGVDAQLRAGWIADPMDELFEDLNNRRKEDSGDWAAYARSSRNHSLCGLLHQDPFTHRAFAKPRGYAGDAVMMDYIYGLGDAAQASNDATPLGRAIFQHLGTRPSAKAVRYRRQLLARLIDYTATNGGSSVLAIAAGHLRETELSEAVQAGAIGEFLALDQDEASLSVVDRDYARLGVRAVPGSVRQILAGRTGLVQYDFVYAAGLFDYLSAPVAAAFASRMFEMTRPGGMLLIPNFLTDLEDKGYMESFMDWHLIYRNHSDMRALAAAFPAGEVANCRIFDDAESAITYLLVSKAGRPS